jgi:putative membrane protein insertion efficiency factor
MRLVLKSLIRLYQITFGVIITPRCRYFPTCSQYSVEAYEVHGVITGTWLTLKRLIKCNPFAGSGYDPVPKRENQHEI